ncbi:MAG TPA: PaaI family thioesterase [Rubrivivax sp.]|nr:PaaI family thioesterase [Rubrivivax sp.]
MQSDKLEEWLAAEAAQRARYDQGAGPGVARPDQVAALDGLAVMRAMMSGELPHPPIAKTLDFMLIEANHGHAVFQGSPGVAHYNPLGTVHGGWYATLLDSALGCCVHTALPAGKTYTTLELKLNLIRALTTQVPRVRAEGRVIHVGGQTATAEARLVGPDGKLYAHGSTTCLVFDYRPPRG